jgi:hypothetical protein
MTRSSTLPIRRPLAALLALALAGATGGAAAQALTPAFTYQGELRLSSGPATAPFDMQFRLFSAATDGVQIGTTVTATNVPVTGGLFSVPLNFGVAQFAGERQWLEIAIRPAGTGTFETLTPRTEVTAAPYAWSAAVALANSVTTTSIVDGTIGTADINATQIQRRVTGSCAAGQYVRIVNQDGTVTCGADANAGGTVTSIATGAGLTGGPITATGTISVAPGGIGTTQINASQVQRRVSGTCAVGSYVREISEDGTVVCGTDATGSDWSLTGNAGTNPATDFIGTTDNQPLVLRVNNQQALRIQPSASSPSLIGGSSSNSVTAGVFGATISGGANIATPNRVTDDFGTVGGGVANLAGDNAGITGDRASATVSGGQLNTASGRLSIVGGGDSNTASGEASTVGGGGSNTASGGFSTVGGGLANTASSSRATVGGGQSNTASGTASTVGGGQSNTASGDFSTVSGGTSNCAGGFLSWASGQQAKVRPGTDPGTGSCSGLGTYPGGAGDTGTFVWADSQFVNFVSTGPNQFLVRAAGGAVITGNSATNSPAGNRLRVDGLLRVDALGTAAATTLCRNADNQISGCSSSARYKSDIADLELGLATALRLHAVGYRWKNTGDADVGFVAEEIATIDERLVTRNAKGEIEGVKYDRLTAVLANAVQELAARDSLAAEELSRVGAENAALRAELERRDAEHRSRLDRLEALLADRGHESR